MARTAPPVRTMTPASALTTALLALASAIASAGARTATLAWDPVAHPGVAGYEVHVGFASGAYEYSVDAGAQTSIALPALAAGRAHFVAVAAYDASRRRGAFSNELVLAPAFVDAVPLTTDFGAFPWIGVAPHAVRFSPAVTGAVVWHRWDFGDGASHVSDWITPLPDFVHVYEKPGTYSVTLTVAGPGGQRASHRAALVKVVDGGDVDGCPCTLWGAAEPRRPDDGSDAPVSVGMRFATSRDGVVTGIRFYRSAANRGPHVGTLWSASGDRLGTVNFPEGTAAGWQQAAFAAPIPVAARASYVVAYHAPHGHVASDDGVFLKNVANGPLFAPAHRASAPNGVHARGPTPAFPTDGDKQTNHWVDVVFLPAD